MGNLLDGIVVGVLELGAKVVTDAVVAGGFAVVLARECVVPVTV